ncbi:MAG: hypothetical protein ACI3YT_10355 [Prevotella sp.]
MERLTFDKKPTVMPFGNKVIVPIGTTETVQLDDEGREVKMFEADVVYLVDKPVTRQNIIETAVNAEFTEEEQKYVMVNMAKKTDALVKKYNEFIEKITEEVEEEGYAD